jgi:hypothetical protein
MVTSGDHVGAMRAVSVLAQIRTPKARRLLEALAAGAAGSPQTRRAKAALLWVNRNP